MHVSLVVWDNENEEKILSLGFTIQEIEDVLYNRRNETVFTNEWYGSLQHRITYGLTKSNKNIAVTSVPILGNPLEVYPVTVYQVEG